MKKIYKYTYFIGFVYTDIGFKGVVNETIQGSTIIPSDLIMSKKVLDRLTPAILSDINPKATNSTVVITSITLLSKRNLIQRFFLSFRKK